MTYSNTRPSRFVAGNKVWTIFACRLATWRYDGLRTGLFCYYYSANSREEHEAGFFLRILKKWFKTLAQERIPRRKPAQYQDSSRSKNSQVPYSNVECFHHCTLNRWHVAHFEINCWKKHESLNHSISMSLRYLKSLYSPRPSWVTCSTYRAWAKCNSKLGLNFISFLRVI